VELLSNGLKLKLVQAEHIAESVYRAVGKASPMVAQVREDNGHYGSKLPIKKEVFAKGIDPV